MDIQALFKITYGLYLVNAGANGKQNGCVVNTIFQVTNTPNQIAVSVAKENYTCKLMEEAQSFSVNVLSQSCSVDTIARFGFQSGTEVDKFKDMPFHLDQLGNPYLTQESVAYYSVKITGMLDLNTHILFVGEVKEAEVQSDESPLTYAYYREVLKGSSPKLAPTYQAHVPEEEGEQGRFQCSICKYIYLPSKGDEKQGIGPHTSFEALPDTWVCPVCKKHKSVFVTL